VIELLKEKSGNCNPMVGSDEWDQTRGGIGKCFYE